VRARRRGETASIFLPSVPQLMMLAGELERERDHALDRQPAEGAEEILLDDDAVDAANESERASADADLFDFRPLSSEANFDRVLYDGGEFGFAAEVGTAEELDFLGLPGLLEPDQVRQLARQRQARHARRSKQRGAPVSQPLYRTLKEQRALLNGLVASRARRTGEPHAHIHAELRRRVGGPPVAQASVAQLQARIDLLRRG